MSPKKWGLEAGWIHWRKDRLQFSTNCPEIKWGSTDRTLQSPGPAQRLGDAVASRVLYGVVSQKQDSTCPKLGGAVHHARRHPRSLRRKDPRIDSLGWCYRKQAVGREPGQNKSWLIALLLRSWQFRNGRFHAFDNLHRHFVPFPCNR